VYWDSSALVPLLLPESSSSEMTTLFKSDSEPATWWGSPIECQSAIYRRHRESPIPQQILLQALERLEAICKTSDVVIPSEEVRVRAGRLLSLHALRAANALHLAAALVWVQEKPTGETFLCLDDRLRDAARGEGFTLLPT